MAKKKETKKETTTKKTSKTTRKVQKNIEKQVEKEIKKQINSMPIWLVIILVIVLGGVYLLYGDQILSFISPNNHTSIPLVLSDDELSLHFLELGVHQTGDSTYIKAGDVDILIDAGAIGASSETICDYVDTYCKDGKLEYVIVTHAHTDHYSGFYGNTGDNKTFNYKGEKIDRTGIFYYYDIGTIIDFSLTNQKEDSETSNYAKYKNAREYAVTKGAKHYSAKECIEETNGAKRIYEITPSVSMTILDSKYYYEISSNENEYSVCTLFSQAVTDGQRHFLLTGDLEKEGEEHLLKMNNLPEVEVFKGGHHGSPTSSTDALLKQIKPKHCAVCCCAGSDEHTENVDNQFPSQAFIDRIAKYTDKVYVTSLAKYDYNDDGKYTTTSFTSQNGNIVARSVTDSFKIECSNNNTILKDSEWFNREIYVIYDGDIPILSDKQTSETVTRKMRTWPTY